MKSNRLLTTLQKVGTALWSFALGFGGVALLLWALESRGVLPELSRDESWSGVFLGMGLAILKFGLCLVGGAVVAVISWCFHPTVFLRSYWLVLGVIALGIGVLLLIYGPNLLLRFFVGPLAASIGGYMIWTGIFGSRSDVEDPPLL